MGVISRKPPNPRTVAQNIISEHGPEAFQKLIDMFRSGESGTKIGRIFGVSRQRVSQWRSTLGVEQVTYLVHPDVQDLVDVRTPRGTRRTAV